MSYEVKITVYGKGAKTMKKSLWQFGTREVVFAAIGAALYGVLSFLTNPLQIPGAANVSVRPGVAVAMFFGVAFGPIVGFISGALGNIIGDLLSGYGFYPWWDLGNGIMAMLPGLIWLTIVNFNDIKNMVYADLMVLVGIVLGMGLASVSEMWVSGVDFRTTLVTNFVPAFIGNAIWGLILVPVLMAYSAIQVRSGR
jgi:energy-coupling factor transport system substrate-specific component